MSVILQRRSAQKVEPIILTPSSGPKVTEASQQNQQVVAADERFFLKCHPKTYTYYQYTNIMAFMYSITNFALFVYINKYAKDTNIDIDVYQFRFINLKKTASVPFLFSSASWFFIAFFFFRNFSVLIERQINPFAVFDNGIALSCLLLSFTALNNITDQSHLSLIAFLSFAAFANILVMEHHNYYMKNMAKTGIRNVQKLELLLPYSISALSLVFAFITPHIIFVNNTSISTLKHTFESISIYMTAFYFVTGLWLLTSTFKYERLIILTQIILMAVKIQFALACV